MSAASVLEVLSVAGRGDTGSMLTLALKSYAKYSRQNGVHDSPCTLVNGILEPKTSPCALALPRSIVPSPTLLPHSGHFSPAATGPLTTGASTSDRSFPALELNCARVVLRVPNAPADVQQRLL